MLQQQKLIISLLLTIRDDLKSVYVADREDFV